MNTERPINLDLTTLKFPVMAIASILHRLSGIGLFVLLPYMLYLLQQSLTNPDSFAAILAMIQSPVHKLVILLFIAALIYHILAGLRHIIMDIGYGEHLDAGRRSAAVVIIAAFILTIVTGIWLW